MSAKDLWEAMTAPTNEEVELERMDKERAMLWRTVDRLEAEKAALENEVKSLKAELWGANAALDDALDDLADADETGFNVARDALRAGGRPVEVTIRIG